MRNRWKNKGAALINDEARNNFATGYENNLRDGYKKENAFQLLFFKLCTIL